MSNVWKPNSPISVHHGQQLPVPLTLRLKRPRSLIVADLVAIASSSSRFRFKTAGGGAAASAWLRVIISHGRRPGTARSIKIERHKRADRSAKGSAPRSLLFSGAASGLTPRRASPIDLSFGFEPAGLGYASSFGQPKGGFFRRFSRPSRPQARGGPGRR